MRVIGEFDAPTAIRNYRLGSAQLVELEPPLAPLTEEKMSYHRQLRQKVRRSRCEGVNFRGRGCSFQVRLLQAT